MNNKSKSKINFKMIIVGILITNFIISFQISSIKDNPKTENVLSIKASDGSVTILATTWFGSIMALSSNRDEQDYFEWSINTIYGPGLSWYMMNDTEFWYYVGLDNTLRTRGNFPYTELLSDEESSASGIFYPPYSEVWRFLATNHYVDILCKVEFTESWVNDFITVDEPTSSSSWEVDTSQYINWTWGGDFDYVDIDLYHAGAFLSNIATNVQNNGSYPWMIPTDISLFDDLYQVNISNSNFADTWGISNAYFEIKDIKTINVINPSTSDSWETGTTHLLTWTSTGSISDVKIELFKDDVFELEIISSTPNDGDFSWTIPSGLDSSTQYQVKITDVSNSLVNNYGDYFEIYVSDSITVTSPDSSSSWENGTTHSLTWTSTGSIEDVKIELFKDDVFKLEIISSTPNDGDFSWDIPSDLDSSTQYQIKITDESNSLVNNYGDYFEIYISDSITVTSPNSSSSWENGTTHSLTWTSTGSIEDVKIELFKDDVFKLEIISSTPNDGDFSWDIPSDLDSSTQYQIKITDESNSLVNNYGDYFEIYISDSITVTSPDSSSSWETGTTHLLTWTSTGSISDVKIELFKDDVFELEIISSTPNDGDFSWTIPSGLDSSTQYQVKITDVSNSLVNNYGDYFEIYVSDSITVTSPDSSSSWENGTTHSLTWTSTGSITYVKIELFKDDVFELEIISSTPNDGDFSWTIPSGLDNSTQYQIKITDVSNSVVNNFGDYFEIYTKPSPSESNGIPGYDLMLLFGLSIASIIGVSERVIFSLRKKILTSEGS